MRLRNTAEVAMPKKEANFFRDLPAPDKPESNPDLSSPILTVTSSLIATAHTFS